MISAALKRAALLAAALLLAVPARASGRLVFGFLAADGGAEGAASKARTDLLSRLERTGRYALVDLSLPSATPFAQACGGEPRLGKVARLELSEGEKFHGTLIVYDCATNAIDPPRVEASSAKLSNLVSSLRADFIAAYPFLMALEVEGGALWAPAGPKEKITPGTALYGYVEESPRTYRLSRKLQVASYHEAAFRSELVERWRVPGAGEAQSGEVLSPEPLSALAAQALLRPVLNDLVAVRRIGERQNAQLEQPPGSGAWVLDPEGELQELHFVAPTRLTGTGVSFAVAFEIDPDGALSVAWGLEATGHAVRLAGDQIVASEYVDQMPGAVLARAPLPPLAGEHRLRIVSYGRWTECYLDGRFILGFEDMERPPGDWWLWAERRAAKVRDVSFFELEPHKDSGKSQERAGGVSP